METPSLRELQHLITPEYAHCWEQIGIGLNLSHSTIRIIERNKPTVQERCTNMFATWLERNREANWNTLLEVIDSPEVAMMFTPISESKHIVS